MSQGPPNNSDLVNFSVVSEEEYRANLKRAEEAQAQLDNFKAMNEAAKKAYDKQQELLRKIQEGKEAERQLQALTAASEPGPLALAGPSGQANSSTSNQQWWYPTNVYSQEMYGTNNHATQRVNQTSGSLHSLQYGDARKFVPYRAAQQPQTSQPVYSQNGVPPQQLPVSQPSRTTTRAPIMQEIPAQQGRQALPMQPVVSALHSNQVQTASQTSPAAFSAAVRSPTTQQGGQSRPHAQSGQGAVVPNFVTSSGMQQYKAQQPSESSLAGALDASKTTWPSQPALSTTTTLPKVPTKQNKSDLDATAARLQAQLNNRPPSQSNMVSVSLSTGGSSRQTDLSPDITKSWQRFSRGIIAWASTAAAPSEMPLTNTKFKVVKDAKSQVFVTLPGTDVLNSQTVTLQTLLASVEFHAKNTSPSGQVVTEPSNVSNAADFRDGYRPYSVPQHQVSQASARREPLITTLESSETARPTTTSASIIRPSTPTSSSATPSSSGRTPSQADKRSLAKDILRALSFPSLKRPQPDDASVVQTLEPPAKRHAPGPRPQKNAEQSSQTTVTYPLQAASFGHISPMSVPSISTNFGLEPPAQRRASGPTLQKNLEQSPQTTVTPHMQAVSSGQISSTSAPLTSPTSEAPISSTFSPESALPQELNSQATCPTTASDYSLPYPSSIQVTPIAPTPRKSPQKVTNADDSVSKNLFPERQKTPLFLPSPSSSPIARSSDSMQGISLNSNWSAVQRAQRGTHPFYILVPPDPLWLQKHKTQRSRNIRRLMVDDELEESSSGGAMGEEHLTEGGQRAEESEEKSIEDEEIDVIDLDSANDLATDEFEREAILLSCSRIRKRPCKWNSCSAILNSTEKLIRHLAYAHQEIFEEFSVCRWQNCGRPAVNWAGLFRHLKGHALIPLQCAYQDCEGSFRTPRQLVKHHRAEHSNDTPKSSATPLVPTLKTPPDASPLILPSYLMESIKPPSMTKERHGNLGPWVLRQIAGPVNHEVKRYNAAFKLLQSPSRSDKWAYQPYDFLNFPSTNYSSTPSLPSKIRGMEDLISGEVSDMVHQGLVLWGIQEDESEDELLPSSPLLQPHPDPVMEEQLDVDAVQSMLEN